MGRKITVEFIGPGVCPCLFCSPNMEKLHVGHSYMVEDRKEECGLLFWFIRAAGWVPATWFSHPKVENNQDFYY